MSRPTTSHAPKVSTATGTKVYVRANSPYLLIVRRSVEAAALPVCLLVVARCELAKVSGVVASQARRRPLAQGIILTPSGLRGEPTIRPVGSLTEGIPALTSALKIRSFMRLWRRILPLHILQDNPC